MTFQAALLLRIICNGRCMYVEQKGPNVLAVCKQFYKIVYSFVNDIYLKYCNTC